MKKLSVSLAVCIAMAGCASKPTNPAGVNTSELPTEQESLSFGMGERYQVKSGDTVSMIAKQFKVDWRTLSKFNNLDDRHTIYAGQWLNIPASTNKKTTSETIVLTSMPASIAPPAFPTPTHTADTASPAPAVLALAPTPAPVVAPPVPTPVVAPTPLQTQEPTQDVGQFIYPVGQNNSVVKGFGVPIPSGLTEGIFFVGNVGDPIFASEDGTVLYANASPTATNRPMVVIEHAKGYVSTYFDVGTIAVQNGNTVKKGERLGIMTPQTKSGRALFEFRIAQNGRYIDPVSVIK